MKFDKHNRNDSYRDDDVYGYGRDDYYDADDYSRTDRGSDGYYTGDRGMKDHARTDRGSEDYYAGDYGTEDYSGSVGSGDYYGENYGAGDRSHAGGGTSRSRGRNRSSGGAPTDHDQYDDAMPSGPSRGRKNGGGKKKDVKSRKSTLIGRSIVFAILEVFAVFGILVFAYAQKQYGKIQRPDVNEQEILNFNLTEEQRAEMEKGYWNIAVFGVDTRDSSVGKGANSDVIIVVSINRETGAIQLVSVFRDTYLKTGDDTYNKINSAYCKGGPEQALKALNENLDLNLTQYVTFNWKAVATGINILGGVDIDISKAEYNWINGYITETVKSTGIGSTQLTGPGLQHLDGVQAVAYARLRYMDNDYARTERQRKVIGEVFKKAKQTNLDTLNSLIGVMLEMVATNMTWQDGLDALANIDKYNITETAGFPFARGEANMGKCGACVIPQTLESNVRDLHAMLFANEVYEPSDQVKQISATISAKTGMYSEGTNIGHVSTEGWIPSSDTKSGSGTVTEETQQEQEAVEAETITKKDDTREYAISQDGYLIYVYDVDENGNKLYKYVKDAEGNRIKMVEKDENGNLVYLYEIDEDGNFYFDEDLDFDVDETEDGELENDGDRTLETDEDGNVLPGQEDDDENYGPGGGTQKSSETETNEYGKPQRETEMEYGPGTGPEPEGGDVYPGSAAEPEGGSSAGPGGGGDSETVENPPI